MVDKPLWRPSQERIEEANLTRFARQAIRDWKLEFNDYPAFYRWTVDRPEQFWDSLWKFAGVRASTKGSRVIVDAGLMPGARWYPDARLNFAENLLRRRDASTAIVFWGENRVKRRLTHRELADQVARIARGLRALGVKPGDRVAAYLPNMPEAIAAMLAAASVRSEEHTSELQSRRDLVCRLLLEKKKKTDETRKGKKQRRNILVKHDSKEVLN